MVTSNILCYGFLHTAISSALRVLISAELVPCIFAGLILGFFIPNIVLFLLLNINLSPYENRVYAIFDFPNIFTFFHIMRVIFTIVGTLNSNGIPIIGLIVFVPYALFLLRNPLITWRYNKLSQIIHGMILYWLIIVIAEFFRNSSFEVGVYLYPVLFTGYLFSLVL